MNAAIIPARWGSTRFPGKPLHLIAGQPLLRRVWERCLRARRLDAVIIATDDMRIAEAAFSWGAEVALTSGKHRSGTDRVAEVVARAPKFRRILNVQGDEPFIEIALLNRLCRILESDSSIGMATAAHPFARMLDANSPHQVKVVLDRRQRALYFSRAKIPFAPAGNTGIRLLRHQGVYAFQRAILLELVKRKPSPLERAERLEQLRALENGVTVHVLVTKHGSPGVDTPADARKAEQTLLRKVRR